MNLRQSFSFVSLLAVASLLVIGSTDSKSSDETDIGSGGFLIEIPYAKVEIGNRIRTNWTVYAHPFEGSIVLAHDGEDSVLAFDRIKKATIKIARTHVEGTDWQNVIAIDEDVPFKKAGRRPYFDRTEARARLRGGELVRVMLPE